MIDYTSNGSSWIVAQVFSFNGSVLHKAFGYAAVNAVLAGVLHWVLRNQTDGEILNSMDDVPLIWTGYTSILGFLVVFRNNQAYSRFWEGATLVRQVRGEWFNSVSALIAFSKKDDPEKKQDRVLMEKTNNFQELLVRLASALYCSALRQVCDLDENALQVLDLSEVTPESVQMLAEAHDRCQLIIFWLQALIIKAEKDRVLDVPSPILSRSFQELSRGMVNLTNLHKIKEIPFPYPYQQMLIVMLIIHNMITSCMAAVIVGSLFWACTMTFMVTGSFWTVIYIAVEIDQPFGDDPNDLPLIEMQEEFNADLVRLLKTAGAGLPQMNKAFAGDTAAQVMNMELELPKNARSGRRKDTTRLKAYMEMHRESEEAEEAEEAETPEPQSPPALDFLEFDLPRQEASSLENEARSRFARYLREAAQEFEKDPLDVHHEFSRAVSDMPSSPPTSPTLRKANTSENLGGSSRLEDTRCASKDKFGKLEEPSSLAASFQAAKHRLQEKAEIKKQRRVSRRLEAVQEVPKTTDKLVIEPMETTSSTLQPIEETSLTSKPIGIGVSLPKLPSEQIHLQ
eukprot:TRINITY_DN21217_c0_g1_i1.p1 TRINITY_DN21217_c0_g1~~TRINITY_DN21217_c0_g1_i1.p1  ORF type:complete len:569 (+),score=124.84 TRINITY_DN21217_c0_g1_i1:84-1790(+)